MISETLGKIYTEIEDKFYSVFDFLEEKGLPVYTLIDPIEEKGIPFFPLSIALIAVLLFVVFGFGVIGANFDAQIELNLVDSYGKGLSQVNIKIVDSTEKEIFKGIKNNGDLIEVKVEGGAELTITAQKQGFESDETKIKVINKKETAELNLKKIINTIKAKIKFYDYETETPVSNVRASIEWKGIIKDAVSNSEGLIEFLDVPLEEDIYITAEADSYYEHTGVISFESEETKSIYLNPKELAFEGESNLIITLFDKETGELIENAKIKVYDAESNDLIDEKIISEGVYSENFPKGIAVRFTAEKEGYKLFESNEFTLRSEEENLGAVELEKGGKEIKIKAVYAETQNPAVGAKITLFDSEKKIINSSTTLYEGLTEFKGLEKEEEYYLGAEKEGYLPETKKIEKETEIIQLTKATAKNSGELAIIVVDFNEKPVANATLYFTKRDSNEAFFVPLGIEAKKTNENGKFTLTVPRDAEITVKAVKDLLQGTQSLEIKSQNNNNMIIKLEKKDSVKSIKFFDAQGKITKGTLIIKNQAGEILFDGEIEEEILFEAGESNFVEFELTKEDGTKYSEEINLEGKTEIEVDLDARKYTEKTPNIEFLGAYDIAGNEVEGITKGKDYILKFKTEWSKGLESGGIHFRTGIDSIKYADSEDIGITGFDAPTNKYFYGRSFTPNPSPGYQEIDYSNSGQGGKLNKFIELYFNEPEGTKIIKVRIKARELISHQTIRMQFRAWSYADGYYYRNPFDEVLEKEKTTEEKQALYADTKEIEIKVYDSEPECMEEACIEYVLKDEDERVYDKKDFFAVKGKVYALEMNAEARLSVETTFRITTSKENPKIGFTGKEVNSFSQFIDNNKSDTSIEFKEIISREGTKIRVYFKAKKTGESSIKSIALTPKDSMTENFYFKVFEEQKMEIQAPETARKGQDFEINVKDNQGKGIENAEIEFYNIKGRLEKTITGNELNGRNGKYRIENNLEAGNYLIKIKADKFKTKEKELQIEFGEGLEIESEAEINIPSGDLFTSKRIQIKNLTEKTIEGITAEIIPSGNFPKQFKLSVNPPAVLSAKEENQTEIILEYSGTNTAVFHGEAEIIITGFIEGIPIKTKTKIKANYNQKLKEDCLEFDKTELKEYLIGAGGNSKELELGLKNNCNQALQFELEVHPKNHSDKEIEFSSGTIKIAKDEVKTIKIGVINKIQRNYARQNELDYDLFLASRQLTKSIPARIILWHEMFALEASPSVVLWLTQSKQKEKATAVHPLYIRNTGLADITNLTFATEFNKPANTKITVSYGYSEGRNVPELRRGMALIPPAVIQAETNTSENQRITGKIIVSGTINGRQYALREINVFVNVSAGWSCLEAWSDDMLFNSPNAEFGSIDKSLNIVNNCVEPVRIIGIEPEKIGGNNITLIDSGYTLPPGTKDEFILRLTKESEANQKIKIKVIGIGEKSMPAKTIHSMPFEIEIAIGKGSGECGNENEPCKWENETTLDYCDKPETTAVYFPKQSENCGQGYCDAQQLGRFLAEKIEEELRKAQLRISDVKSVENLGAKCNLIEDYCSFGAMGITTESFEFYFKNDNLTTSMLESEIKKLGAKEIQSLYIRHGETEQELYSTAGKSFGEHLLLLPSIRGCGRYQAKFIGAVAVNGNEIRKDSVSLLLKIEGSREETPECYNRIQNFMNFLPVNEDYSPSRRNGSWLGLIIRNPEIEELQKSFSKTLFKDNQGARVTQNQENNLIRVSKGSFDQTKGIVKIEIERSGASNTPKQIDVYITDKYFNSSEEIQNDIAGEAGLIISNLKNGKIEQGCISSEMDYLILGSVKNISEIANLKWIETENFVNLYPNAENCVDLKMSSKLNAPEAELSLDFVNENLQGIQKNETVFKYSDGREITNKGETEFNLNNVEWKEAGTNYEFEFKLCFTGSENPRLAKNSKLKLNVTGLKEKTLQFGVCSISPIEFIERSKEISKPGNYYATIDWKGEPNKIPFEVLMNAYYLKHPKESPSAQRQSQINERKAWGLVGYGIGSIAGFAITAAATGGTLGAGMIAKEMLFGTAPAIGIAAFSSGKEVKEITENSFKTGLKSIGIDAGELEEVQKGTGLSNDEFFRETVKLHAINQGAKETIKNVLPLSEEAKKAKETADALASIGDKELIDEFSLIKKDISGYNGAKKTLTKTEITKIGTYADTAKPIKVPGFRKTIDVAGKRFIEIKVPITGSKRILIEGITDPNYTGFDSAYDELIKAIGKTRVQGRGINAQMFVDETFRNTVGGLGSGRNPSFIIDGIAGDAETGLIKRIEDWGAKVDAKANPATPEGKKLLEMKNKFVDKTVDDISQAKKTIKAPSGASQKAITKQLGQEQAVSKQTKLEAFSAKNPKWSRLAKGLLRSGGTMAGGIAGWMLANALMGDYDKINEPEAELNAIEFEKGKTYKVKIKAGYNTGKPIYTYSEVASENLANIKNSERLDSDSCESEPEMLSQELIEIYQKAIKEKNE